MAGRGLIFISTIAFFVGQSSFGGPIMSSSPAPAAVRSDSPQEELIRINKAQRQVIIAAEVSQADGPAEALLCKEGARNCRSLLTTRVEPSAVHKALLALGLRPGRSAQWVTPAGGEPVFAPPRGPAVDVRLRWTGADGKSHECESRDWLLAAATKKPLAEPVRWVFVGSDFLDDGRYWGDIEGRIISLANCASSVLDVPFPSTDKDALLEFAAGPQVVPPKGTAVEVVLTVANAAATAPAARLTFVIDQFGRIEMDGAPVAIDDVAGAARSFLARHVGCAAEIRVDPRTLVYDLEQLKAALREAGLTDIKVQTLPIHEKVLPRTAGQSAQAITWWRQQFSQAKEMVADPAQDAARVVKSVEHRRQEVQALSDLWGEYAEQLRELIRRHNAATQSGPANP